MKEEGKDVYRLHSTTAFVLNHEFDKKQSSLMRVSSRYSLGWSERA